MAAKQSPEMVWDVVDSGGSEPWFVTLPRDVFEDRLAKAEAWTSSTWGELRATATRDIYESVCSLHGFDPDLDPGSDGEEAPPADDAELEERESDDGFSAPWGLVWRDMWNHWPDEVAVEEEMEVDSIHDGFLMQIPGTRADDVIGWFREAGISATRDHRMWRLLPPST